jgi:hypothetical protein
MSRKIVHKKFLDHSKKLLIEEFDPRSYDKKKVVKNVVNNTFLSIPVFGTFYGIYIGIHSGKKKEIIKKQQKRADDIEKMGKKKKK